MDSEQESAWKRIFYKYRPIFARPLVFRILAPFSSSLSLSYPTLLIHLTTPQPLLHKKRKKKEENEMNPGSTRASNRPHDDTRDHRSRRHRRESRADQTLALNPSTTDPPAPGPPSRRPSGATGQQPDLGSLAPTKPAADLLPDRLQAIDDNIQTLDNKFNLVLGLLLVILAWRSFW